MESYGMCSVLGFFCSTSDEIIQVVPWSWLFSWLYSISQYIDLFIHSFYWEPLGFFQVVFFPSYCNNAAVSLLYMLFVSACLLGTPVGVESWTMCTYLIGLFMKTMAQLSLEWLLCRFQTAGYHTVLRKLTNLWFLSFSSIKWCQLWCLFCRDM